MSQQKTLYNSKFKRKHIINICKLYNTFVFLKKSISYFRVTWSYQDLSEICGCNVIWTLIFMDCSWFIPIVGHRLRGFDLFFSFCLLTIILLVSAHCPTCVRRKSCGFAPSVPWKLLKNCVTKRRVSAILTYSVRARLNFFPKPY